MKTLSEQSSVDEILTRIEKLTPQTQRQWGKMDAAQMLAHCGNALEMSLGIQNPRRVFIGRLIGPIFKSKYTEEKPFPRDNPTSAELKVTDARDFVAEKNRLIKLVKQFYAAGEAGVTKHPHPFFGKLTPREWIRGMYKHLDHHLSQFGA